MNNAFIIGTGRCGTTWLGQMLNSHAELCVPPEIQLLFEYSGNGNRLFEEFFLADQKGLSGEQLASVIERCCPHKLEIFFDYQEFCRKHDTPKMSLAEFVKSFYAAIASAHGKSWLVEQTPWYGQRLDLVSKLFPDAKFIHMVRDGRDVALSFARTTWWHISPRLNLARWQREIKKIATDASSFLKPDCYLEVKYEDLVANPESELRKVCTFLGIEFDPRMLDPAGFIDYDKLCKFDMAQVSSKAYSAWRERKDGAVFSENVAAWRKTDNLFDDALPIEISDWLSRYGYEVRETASTEVDKNQSRHEYSFGALEQDNLARASHIHTLEQELTRKAENLDVLEKEWVARGVLIEELGKSMDLLMHESENRAEHIRTLEQVLAKQTTQAGVIEKEWGARGELLDYLAATINALGQENEKQVEHIHVLERALSSQTEQVSIVGEEWSARGELLDELAATIDALTQESQGRVEYIQTLEQALFQQTEQASVIGKEWEARGDLLAQLSKTINALTEESQGRLECIRLLEQSLAQQAEHSSVVENEWQARGQLLDRLTTTLDAVKQESDGRAEHINVLEQALFQKTEQAEETENRWEARGNVIDKLTQSVEALMQETKSQAKHIEQLSQENIVSLNRNSQLDQEIADQKVLIDQLEERLNEFRRSWYGILKEYLGK
ncbi:septal ring factor EnvC (AmiA/AmiB activator) [Pseudomonas sp. 3296]|uniref:sulfotransferase n=1 Tax=Pseudomonas sp. 3296 TaxID=2817753 RepID=UPI00285AEA2D|nr:sulfotransferase [Pseudomonas sp. 3296]MDR6918656.1 septal ring factor EnvC (AmiA/AmiB activator) [Pseudomonas sp. 3296]